MAYTLKEFSLQLRGARQNIALAALFCNKNRFRVYVDGDNRQLRPRILLAVSSTEQNQVCPNERLMFVCAASFFDTFFHVIRNDVVSGAYFLTLFRFLECNPK